MRLPIVGVNTFVPKKGEEEAPPEIQLMRSTEEEKSWQIESLRRFQENHAGDAPKALEKLRDVARSRENIFDELMDAAKHASLGQISHALYEVGGEYRRNM